MIAFRRFLVAGFATLLVAGACTSVTLPSIPPINIPSIPPINIPSNLLPSNLPTIPPIPSNLLPSNLPSIPPQSSGGIVLPSFDFSFPPIELPSADANSGVCLLVSPAEMSTIVGGQVTVTSNDSNSCTYTLPSFATVVVTLDNSEDLSGVQFLMGEGAQSTTIGGFPALAGTVLGQPAVYVQKPGQQLQVLGVLVGSDQASIDQMVQIANTAVARWQ